MFYLNITLATILSILFTASVGTDLTHELAIYVVFSLAFFRAFTVITDEVTKEVQEFLAKRQSKE